MRVLICEDNGELAELVQRGLAGRSLDSDVVDSLADAREALRGTNYAALVLDIGLPDGSGLSLLAELRDQGNPVPILLLTARGALDDRVGGLEAGADDYLVKPFALDELAARIKALLRRPGALLGPQLSAGDICLDLESRQVSVAGAPATLSMREVDVLEILLRRAGRVVPKKIIEDHLFGLSEAGSNAVEVYVHRIRRQLGDMNAACAVVTVRGVGYMLAPQDP